MNKHTPAVLGVVLVTALFWASNTWGQGCRYTYFDCGKLSLTSGMCINEDFDLTAFISPTGRKDYDSAPSDKPNRFVLSVDYGDGRTHVYHISDPTRMAPARISNPNDINDKPKAGYNFTLQYKSVAKDAKNLQTIESISWAINGIPHVDAASQNVCGSGTNISMSNDKTDVIGPMSFAWTIPGPGRNNVEGGHEQLNEDVKTNRISTDDGNPNTNDALIPYISKQALSLLNGSVSGSVIFRITPITVIGGCKGTPVSITININPSPLISVLPAYACDGVPTELSPTILNTPASNAFFTVAITTDPEVTVISPVAENKYHQSAIHQTFKLRGTTPKTATYTFTPWGVFHNATETEYTCEGHSANLVVTVNPVPALTGINSSQVCAGTNPLPFTVSGYNSPPTYFSYTDSNGATAEGLQKSGNNLVNNPTLKNNKIAMPVTLKGVTIKYGDIDHACLSNAMDISFTVMPIPVIRIMNPNPLPDTWRQLDDILYTLSTCDGSTLPTITFDSDLTGIYSWTNDQVVGGSTGGTSNTINLSTPLVNTDGSDKTGVLTLISKQGSCVGDAKIAITVHPNPAVDANPATQRFCHGAASQPVNFSSVTTGVTFDWKNNNTAPNTGGFPARGSGNISATTAANDTNAPLLVNFEVTVTKNYPSPDNALCVSRKNYTMQIDPIPTATAQLTKTICSNTSAAIDMSGGAKNVTGTQFIWTATPASYGALDNTTPSAGPIADVLKLTDGITMEHVTYTITPIANSCVGSPVKSTITITPPPEAYTDVNTPTVCHHAAINIGLRNSIGTPDVKYVWTVNQAGIQDGNNSLTQDAPGYDGPIQDVLQLTGDAAGTAIYSVWAITDKGCKSAQPATATITVRAKPVITKDLSPLTYCEGSTVTLPVETTQPTDRFKWYLLPPNATANSHHLLLSPNALTDTNPYSGTNTAALTISNIPESYSGNQYQVEVTDGNCPNSSNRSSAVTLTSQFFGMKASSNKTSLAYGEKVTFNLTNAPETATAKWTFGDDWYSEERSPVHYYYQKGTLTPSVTLFLAATNCSYTYPLSPITVQGTDGDVFTEDPSRTLSVFPIPVHDVLTVKSTGKSKVTIYNVQGQLQLEREGNGLMEISLSDKPQGLFILKVRNDERDHWIKIIKE